MRPDLLWWGACALAVGALQCPSVCQESAVLPEAGAPVTCPAGAQVAIDRAEEGPVVLCLCPAMDDVEIDPATVRLEAGP